MLKGYKTYLVMFVGIIVNGAFALGYIPAEYIELTNMLLAYLGLGALRAGVSK